MLENLDLFFKLLFYKFFLDDDLLVFLNFSCTDFFSSGPSDWLNNWFNDRLNDWLNDWLNDRLNDRLNNWLNDWLNKRLGDRLRYRH